MQYLHQHQPTLAGFFFAATNDEEFPFSSKFSSLKGVEIHYLTDCCVT
jgi:hypothetical protein